MLQSLELNQRHHVMHLLPEVDCSPKAWTVLKKLHGQRWRRTECHVHCPPVSRSPLRLSFRSPPPLILDELVSCVVLVSSTLPPDSPLAPPTRSPLSAASTSMHSRLLVSGLPRSLPPLPRSLAPPCLPCVEERQHAAPHSSLFPPTTAPLQTLHMDVWGPAPVRGTDQERYFLVVVDDNTRYTTVFPLHSKADVRGVLIPWICATRHQLRQRFRRDLPVLRLHSDRGGEFSSGLLSEFCRDESIV
ncbi:unnamed protein product [Closterium sp. NIES-54]